MSRHEEEKGRTVNISIPEAQRFAIVYENENGKIYQGDNVVVMNSLVPEMEGAIKCAYLDPPYNNGEQYEHYSDKEISEDWIKSIEKRIDLIKYLLSEDGSLWISIDDGEMPYLRVLCDKIFKKENFVATIIWNHRKSRENRRAFSFNHEYIVVYAKNYKSFKKSRNSIPLSDEVLSRYKNPDNDEKGVWQSVSATAQAGHATGSQFYEITSPSGMKFFPPPGRCWAFPEERMLAMIAEGRITFGPHGKSVPRLKKYKAEVTRGLTPETIWLADDVGTTDDAKKHFIKMFPEEAVFDTPKPERLLERIMQIATNHGDLVLDSYLGTGTTAVVADRMGRKFIGIEQGDHAQSICVRRMQLNSPTNKFQPLEDTPIQQSLF